MDSWPAYNNQSIAFVNLCNGLRASRMASTILRNRPLSRSKSSKKNALMDTRLIFECVVLPFTQLVLPAQKLLLFGRQARTIFRLLLSAT